MQPQDPTRPEAAPLPQPPTTPTQPVASQPQQVFQPQVIRPDTPAQPSATAPAQPSGAPSAPAAYNPIPGVTGAVVTGAPTPMPTLSGSNPPQQPAQPYAPIPGQPSPFQAPAEPSGDKKKFLIRIGVILAALLVLVLLGTLVKNIFSGLKLASYSTKNYSIQVPADYKKTESGDGVNFSEDDKEATRSEITVYYSEFNPPLTEDQVTAIRQTLQNQLKSSADDIASKDGQTVTNLNVTDTTFQGKDALTLTADVTENDDIKGSVRMVAVVNDKQIYIIGIAAHSSDKDLIKKQDAIINSFNLK